MKISPLAVLRKTGEMMNWEMRIRSRRRENFFFMGFKSSSSEL
jgi:hypothetical protein